MAKEQSGGGAPLYTGTGLVANAIQAQNHNRNAGFTTTMGVDYPLPQLHRLQSNTGWKGSYNPPGTVGQPLAPSQPSPQVNPIQPTMQSTAGIPGHGLRHGDQAIYDQAEQVALDRAFHGGRQPVQPQTQSPSTQDALMSRQRQQQALMAQYQQQQALAAQQQVSQPIPRRVIAQPIQAQQYVGGVTNGPTR